MRSSRLRTLLIGLVAGVAYAFLVLLLFTLTHQNVSIAYIFAFPMVLGAIPVLLSTKEQLRSYTVYLLLPWGIVMTFFFLCLIGDFEGMICLVIIIAPFLLLVTLGAFIFRMIRLRKEGIGTKLYASLLLPIMLLAIEGNISVKDEFHIVSTQIEVRADQATIWENIKNVKNISASEIRPRFIHLIGIPRPIDGTLDGYGIGAIRRITWEKGIKFQEKITSWEEGSGFTYDIIVDPKSIPPTTLDQHVMIGGKYFDVVKGSYSIKQVSPGRHIVSLKCKYRVTTTLNQYSKLWADFILDDFNEMILEVIKMRSEVPR